jgi:carbon-monoxide dehydrogenase medium subunit
MKPAAFDYHAPASREEALSLLARYGPDARPLAGGQSLVAAMNFRRVRPAVLIDLNRIADLGGIAAAADGSVVVGAMARQRDLERSDLIRARLPALAEALPQIGFPQTRNRGTLGGSLAYADPAAELPALAVALQARLRVQHSGGERWVAAADFLLAPFATALQPHELLVEIVFPPPDGGAAFAEVNRRQSHRAEAGAIGRVLLDGERFGACQLTLFGVADRPFQAADLASALAGRPATPESIAAAAADLAIESFSDQYASAAYRQHLCRVLARQTLLRALERARRSS